MGHRSEFEMLVRDLLELAKGKLYGLDGLFPNRNYTMKVPVDESIEYYLKGVYKDNKGDYVGDYTPLPERYAEMPEPDLSRYEQKPFKTDRETLEEYMNRISVSDVPENLLIKDDKGRIIGMKKERTIYQIPNRPPTQTFAP